MSEFNLSSESALSDRKLAANRANAQKSTGPRSLRGKAIAAMNGLRHGIFAKDLLLPGESAEELTALKVSIVRRCNPRDALELALVERVVCTCWKLKRLQRYERLLCNERALAKEEDVRFQRDESGVGETESISADALWLANDRSLRTEMDRLAGSEHRLDNTLQRTLKQLDVMQKKEVEEELSEFAGSVLAGETGAAGIWQTEATAKTALVSELRGELVREHEAEVAEFEASLEGEDDEALTDLDEDEDEDFDEDDDEDDEDFDDEPAAAESGPDDRDRETEATEAAALLNELIRQGEATEGTVGGETRTINPSGS